MKFTRLFGAGMVLSLLASAAVLSSCDAEAQGQRSKTLVFEGAYCRVWRYYDYGTWVYLAEGTNGGGISCSVAAQ